MFPLWFDMTARVWLHAQHALLDNTVAMMRLVTGVRRSPPMVRAAERCGACGGELRWAGLERAQYQRCPGCGLIRFHAPQPHLAPERLAQGGGHL